MACAACQKQRKRLSAAIKRGDVSGTVTAAVVGVKMMAGPKKGQIVKNSTVRLEAKNGD